MLLIALEEGLEIIMRSHDHDNPCFKFFFSFVCLFFISSNLTQAQLPNSCCCGVLSWFETTVGFSVMEN